MLIMPYNVYILLSHKDQKLYVGCTSDLAKRLKRHKAGLVQATKFRRPLTVIHSENYEDKTDAFKRERFLKSLWGGRFKRKVLKNYLNRSNNIKG